MTGCRFSSLETMVYSRAVKLSVMPQGVEHEKGLVRDTKTSA